MRRPLAPDDASTEEAVMAGKHFGYDSPEAFAKAVEREMEAMQSHSADRGREPTIPKKKAEPKPKIEGAPGSMERWKWAAKMVGDPSIRACSMLR